MKKHMKRLLCLTLVLSLAFCMVFSVSAADTEETAESEETAQAADVITEEEPPAEEETPKPEIQDARSLSKGQIFGTVPASAMLEDEPIQSGAAPDKVTGLSANSDTKNTVRLSWKKSNNASGYNIYYKNLTDTSSGMVLLTSVKATQFTIRNIPSATKYEFTVCGYNVSGGNVTEGEDATVKTATRPDDVPFVILTASSIHIGLRWGSSPRVDGYIVYREDRNTGGQYTRQKVLDSNTKEYYDLNTSEANPYNYRVAPFIKIGNQVIEGSSQTLETYCGVSAVGDRGSYSLLSKAYLQWNYNKYATGYEVFYSSNGTDYSVMTSTTGNCYNSFRLGTRRYGFRIRPYIYIYGRKIVGTFDTIYLDITPNAYGDYVGSTYVAICIETQHMWFYKNNNLIVDTPVVTGNYNSMDTPKGYHSVQSKASPCTLVGAGYVSYVEYWIAFIGSGYGIHDASWRSEFGGEIYKGNGSHGCVNTPYDAVEEIYYNISVGTPVIVY